MGNRSYRRGGKGWRRGEESREKQVVFLQVSVSPGLWKEEWGTLWCLGGDEGGRAGSGFGCRRLGRRRGTVTSLCLLSEGGPAGERKTSTERPKQESQHLPTVLRLLSRILDGRISAWSSTSSSAGSSLISFFSGFGGSVAVFVGSGSSYFVGFGSSSMGFIGSSSSAGSLAISESSTFLVSSESSTFFASCWSSTFVSCIGSGTSTFVPCIGSGSSTVFFKSSGRSTGFFKGSGRSTGFFKGLGRSTGFLKGSGRSTGFFKGSGRSTGFLKGSGRSTGFLKGRSTGFFKGSGRSTGFFKGSGRSTSFFKGSGRSTGFFKGSGRSTSFFKDSHLTNPLWDVWIREAAAVAEKTSCVPVLLSEFGANSAHNQSEVHDQTLPQHLICLQMTPQLRTSYFNADIVMLQILCNRQFSYFPALVAIFLSRDFGAVTVSAAVICLLRKRDITEISAPSCCWCPGGGRRSCSVKTPSEMEAIGSLQPCDFSCDSATLVSGHASASDDDTPPAELSGWLNELCFIASPPFSPTSSPTSSPPPTNPAALCA
ncbi:hypothetical protein F7725_024203 [Dissostichus mawsoni]|uniref:Uncharacterized protein n=1 Tax=Dissostichus mawsoni TaxID=36200 RepID=A0A7J5XYS3_DISMA|nr:hypothetical protein F7725_024203 [Dissostichus mawsoni]